MSVGRYDIGDDVVLRATFKDLDGVLTSPFAVACRVMDPAGTVTTVTASEASAGVWEATFAPTVHGGHWYRFEGTGTVRAAGEQAFIVSAQRVGV
jgi:hypothetical protein